MSSLSLMRQAGRRAGLMQKSANWSHVMITKRNISIQELEDRKADRTRLVVLGTGWGGFSLVRAVNTKYYQPVVISPRPYFVFTPLLASTSVGTLEPRTALEGVRSAKGVEYYEASVTGIDFAKKELQCTSGLHGWNETKTFTVPYDKLVIAVGSHTQTFGIPGVQEHAFFLKETRDAIKIRRRILACFEEASLPSTSEARRKQLLHFCVVGGGPTGVEFSAELHDLIHDDISKRFASLIPDIRITLYDVAPRILSGFDSALAEYAAEYFARQGIEVRTRRSVTMVEDGILHVKEEGKVPFGMLVWSTGVEMTPLIRQLSGVKKDARGGRILTDNFLRVLSPEEEPSQAPEESHDQHILPDVYALGDCAVIDGTELPLTAQVASQKGVWLSKRLNLLGKKGLHKIHATPVEKVSSTVETKEEPEPDRAALITKRDPEAEVGPAFSYRHFMVLAYLGGWRGLAENKGKFEVKGRAAWILWRTAYLTMTISWRNKLRIPLLWAINYFFGRDITHL